MSDVFSTFRHHMSLTLIVCAVAVSAAGQAEGDVDCVLAEADRLAWLREWGQAEPLYARARAGFIEREDKPNALYAEVSRLRGQLPTLAVPEVSERLAAYLPPQAIPLTGGVAPAQRWVACGECACWSLMRACGRHEALDVRGRAPVAWPRPGRRNRSATNVKCAPVNREQCSGRRCQSRALCSVLL